MNPCHYIRWLKGALPEPPQNESVLQFIVEGFFVVNGFSWQIHAFYLSIACLSTLKTFACTILWFDDLAQNTCHFFWCSQCQQHHTCCLLGEGNFHQWEQEHQSSRG